MYRQLTVYLTHWGGTKQLDGCSIPSGAEAVQQQLTFMVANLLSMLANGHPLALSLLQKDNIQITIVSVYQSHSLSVDNDTLYYCLIFKLFGFLIRKKYEYFCTYSATVV